MLTPRTAASTSASGKTITGSEPPSSAETRLNLGAAISIILRPVCVLPVRATLLTSGWVASASNLFARARYDVQNPRRKLCLLHQLGDAQRGERGGIGRLHHDRVASGERRSGLGSHQREREVIGHDRGTYADRLLDYHAVGASERRRQVRVHTFDLVGKVSIVGHPVQEVVKFSHRLGERLALLAYQELRDLLGVLLYLRYPGPHQLGAIVRILLRPLGERFLRRGDRRVHVIRATLWNRVERHLRRRVYDRRLLAGPGSYLLSAYQGLRHARYLLSLFRLPNTPVVPCT